MLSSHPFKKLQSKRIYSIEGNIGAGKTTILKLIGKTLDDVVFVEEPVSQWQNLGGMNLLEHFYEDPDRWGFSFEFYVMLSKLKALSNAANSDKDIIILERSLFSNKIFMDISAKLGKLNEMEYHMLLNIFDFFIEHIYPMLNGIIYLRTPVDECIRRIVKRNRGEETSIDKGYLTLLQDKYDGFLNECSIPTLVINGNYDINRDSNKIAENINKFMHPSRTASVILE